MWVERREIGNAAVTNALRVSTLLTEIWGSEQVADTGYLRLYMSQLRKKLAPSAGAQAAQGTQVTASGRISRRAGGISRPQRAQIP